MTPPRKYSPPLIFLFLVLPPGISFGFISVTLPYILTQHGFTVGEAATITAVAISSNLWWFLWSPIVDLTLSLHKWYVIGLAFTALSLLSIYFVPLETENRILLTVIAFISQIASTFNYTPVGGFMAKTVKDEQKGRAAGWYQAGNLGGMGIGGGAGLWIASNYSFSLSVFTLSVSMLICVFGLYFLPKVIAEKVSLKDRLSVMTLDLKRLFKSRIALFSIALFITPIGIGGSANLWSSVAFNWDVNADNIAIVVGVLSAIASVIGCVIGGWVADCLGRWWAFFGAGSIMAGITLLMAISPNIPIMFNTGVLLYAVSTGMAYAAFSAVVLHVIGKGAASTKYALLSSFGNIAPVYMTAINGWVYDGYGIQMMLLSETVLGLSFVIIFLGLLSKFKFEPPIKSPSISTVEI